MREAGGMTRTYDEPDPFGGSVKLGHRYRDIITGESGVATARTERLHGPTEVLLEREGRPSDAEWWVSEQRLRFVSFGPAGVDLDDVAGVVSGVTDPDEFEARLADAGLPGVTALVDPETGLAKGGVMPRTVDPHDGHTQSLG